MKCKITINLLLCLVLLVSSVTTYALEEDSEGGKKNKYVEQYLSENKGKIQKTNEFLVDAGVEEKIMLHTLTYYYQKDLAVGQSLAELYNEPSLYTQATSLEKVDKIRVMHKIIDIYFSLEDSSNKKAYKDFIHRYASSSEDDIAIKFLEETFFFEQESFSIMSTYNGNAAGNWAYNNWNTYSSDYPAFVNWGSDCTNFVSQAMHVGGGKPMEGDWYVTKKNSTYLFPKSAEELNFSWTLTDPSPWISVVLFRNHWNPKSVTHGMSTDFYRNNHQSVYGRSIYKGDVVIFHKGWAGWITTPTHIMIISAYDATNKDFKLAGHSNNRQALPLLDAIDSYSYIEILEIP